MEIITRAQALERGLKRYYTGEACKRNHVSERCVRSYQCVMCINEDTKKDNRLHRTQRRETARKYRSGRPEIDMICRARRRAKIKGIPFELTVNDITIPEMCPVLGIPLKVNVGQRKPSANSPSLDRIRPELGYVVGNIAIISHRANTLKNESTLDELKLILSWVERNC